jgi:hypothetical protein
MWLTCPSTSHVMDMAPKSLYSFSHYSSLSIHHYVADMPLHISTSHVMDMAPKSLYSFSQYSSLSIHHYVADMPLHISCHEYGAQKFILVVTLQLIIHPHTYSSHDVSHIRQQPRVQCRIAPQYTPMNTQRSVGHCQVYQQHTVMLVRAWRSRQEFIHVPTYSKPTVPLCTMIFPSLVCTF